MTILRRNILAWSAGAVVLAALLGVAAAADYPARPVKIYEGFGVGGTPDLISRLIGDWLSRKLGQPFVVENRTGAAGNIATQAVISSPADGYTLLTCLSANAINASLYDNLDFNFLADTVPVAGLIRLPMVLLVNPSFPAKTFDQFLAYAKANPGKINMASPGIGTPMQVGGELIDLMAGVKMELVPYRGPAGAFTDLLAGRVQAFIITVPAAIGFIRDGRLRALAVTTAARSDVLPDVPAIGEPSRASMRPPGTVPVRQRARRTASLTRSTPRSPPASPIARSRTGSRTSAASQCRCRPRSSASSSPTKPRNGLKS